MRAHDACRRDLMTARHRVSKMLLRHGRVYPESSTWTIAHRRWLSRQQFDETVSELVFADLLASVDGLTGARRRSRSGSRAWPRTRQWWPTVARLRCFRGVDTLTAFALHLELGGDWQRFARANALSAWLGLTPSLHQSGESSHQGSITKTGSGFARRLLVRVGLALRTPTTDRGDPQKPPAGPARARPADLKPRPTTAAPGLSPHARPRQAAQRDRRRVRPRARMLPLGSSNRRLTLADSPTGRESGAPGQQRPARAIELWAAPRKECHARS